MKKNEKFISNIGYEKREVEAKKPSILFVYNADSGIFKTLTDYTHKIVKPSTYGCNLCAVTYGNFGMKSTWKDFVSKLELPVDFLHKDEFMKSYKNENVKFPIAFIKRGLDLSIFITSDEINECKTLKVLMNLVTNKLKRINS